MRIFFKAVFLILLGVHSTDAQLSLPDIFTDDMVLQRNEPIHFWGVSDFASIHF